MMLAIAGSRRVNLAWVSPPLMQLIASLPADVTVLLRKPRTKGPNPFEATVEELCRMRGMVPYFVVPEAGRNRVGTFVRDIAMVDSADAVIVFLDPEEDPLGESGTAHILQKAVDANRPLYAYAVTREGLEWIGGNDTPNRLTTWSDAVSDIAKEYLT